VAAPNESIGPTQRAIEMAVAIALLLVFLGVSVLVEAPQDAKRLGVIVGAGLTLVMYSFLYRDNPLFKIAENLYVGVALGYGAILTWQQSLKPEIVQPLFIDPPHAHAMAMEALRRAVPILLGVLLLTRLSRKHSWMSRYSYTLLVGWGAGISIPIAAHSYILEQLKAAVRPLVAAAAPAGSPGFVAWIVGSALPFVGALAVLVGTVTVLFYFFFSVEHKGVGGAISRVGIWFLMISFGASFGYTVMGRVSLLIGRVQFLIHEWLQVPP